MKTKFLLICFCALTTVSVGFAQVKKIGIIGLDTSHSIEFTKMINDKTGQYPEFEGYEVVAAYPRGSYTIPSSYERIPSYIETVSGYGVKITESIEELLDQVDYVLLETNDGTMHLEQAAIVFKAGKRMFIDKPVAASLSDAIAIYELSARYGVPCFSSSSLRYTADTKRIVSGEFGQVLGADSFGPDGPEPSHVDFSWYGIHAVEALFTVMGTGCEEVTRVSVPGTDVVVGKWCGDRIGTFRANEAAKYGFGGWAFTKDHIAPIGSEVPYPELVKEILKFFDTGVVPVTPEETLEIFTFMEAAVQSKKQNGATVSTRDVYDANKVIALEALKKYE